MSSNDEVRALKGKTSDNGLDYLTLSHRRTSPTVKPTKEKLTIKMDDCSDSDGMVSATKKRPSRSTKKRVVYFSNSSNSELEFDEDGNEAPKKRSFKKNANTTDSDSDKFELGPMDADDDMSIANGTVPESSKSTRLYTSHALAPVTNSLLRKKKSRPSQRQSSGKENWGNDVKKPRVVSLSPEDNRKTLEQHYLQAHIAPSRVTQTFFSN
jgi:hypothetical protein